MSKDETPNATSSSVTMDDGAKLQVRFLGDGNGSSSKPLLISLHGAPGLSTHLEPAASYTFLSSVYRVLVYDGRGSGGSDHIGPFSHDRWIKDIENLRKFYGADKFVLAGASYGGFLALDYATRHGDRLDGLILRGAWADGKVGPMRALANILTSDKVKVDTERQVRVWSGTLRDDKDFEDAIMELLPFYAPPLTADVQDISESTEFQGTVKYHSATQNYAFSVNMPQFDVRDKLHTIKAPTYVLVGRHDNVTPVACSQDIARGIPRSVLEIFEHSGHSPPSDEPKAFEASLAKWLKAEGLPSTI